MKKLAGLLALTAVVLLGGCTLFTPDEDAQGEVREIMLQTLQERRQTWQEHDVSDYTWSYTAIDTRESRVPQEVTAVVRDGEVVEVEVDAGYTEPGPLEEYLTISRAFDIIERALVDEADNVRVAYSDGTNYLDALPLLIEVDYERGSSGDERYVDVDVFEVAEE